jgi:hypothetical protein
MAAINTDPFTNGSISTIIEDGMAYYIIQPGSPLFKATKRSDTLVLTPPRLSFFGVHNMDPVYIASYENEYGIIFAFQTTRLYKLLALDHPDTKATLYNRAPENIKKILRKNYGYNTILGTRDSELDSDLALSQYLCDQGFQGYATNSMATDTGEFHPEFMICRVDGLTPLGRITNNTQTIANILERGRLDQASQALKVSRKGKQRTESQSAARAPLSPVALSSSSFASYGSPGALSSSPFASYGSPGASYSSPLALSSSRGASYGRPVAQSSSKTLTFDNMNTYKQENITPNLFNSGLFADDTDDEDIRGGLRKRKTRSYKKRKTRTNKRKRSKISAKKGTRRRR